MDQVKEHPLQLEIDRTFIRGTWFEPAVTPAPILIVLHGIPRQKPASGDSSYREIGLRFARAGLLSIIFNFRGTGVSEGDLTMAAWIRDLEAVIAVARDLPAADPERLALLGFSAGASVAIRVAAADLRVGAVVSGSSPAEYSFLNHAMAPGQWVELFRNLGLIRTPGFPPSIDEWQSEFEEVAPEKWVHRLAPRPLLLIHGDQDEVIPAEHAKRLHQLAGEPKRLVLIPGGLHRLRMDVRALDLAQEWLVQWMDGNGPRPDPGATT